MLTITSLEEIQAYRAAQALSQSELKRIEHGLAHYKTLQAQPAPQTESMLIGSLVDTMLLGQMDDEGNLFHIINDGKLPSESIQQLVQAVSNRAGDGVEELIDCEDLVAEIVLGSSWQTNWKDETRIAKVLEQGAEYFHELMRAKGKTIVTHEQYLRASSTVGGLLGNPITRRLFDRNLLERQKDASTTYQLPLEFEWEGIRCKALLDMLTVRKSNGLDGYVICDLKTTSGLTNKFPEAVRKYRYDLQMAFYRLAVTKTFGVDPRDVTCQLVVESTTEPGSPRIYTCSQAFMQDAETSMVGLLREWKWYQENQFNDEHANQVLQTL